jgi:uncharacterized membrane protein
MKLLKTHVLADKAMPKGDGTAMTSGNLVAALTFGGRRANVRQISIQTMWAPTMSIYRIIAFAVAAASAAAMLYVGLYQSRLVGRLVCPVFGDGCEGVADAPFARPFGIPDGYIGAAVYLSILALLLAPPARWVWIALLALASLATLANVAGVRDMMNFGSYCFYCLTTTLLSPLLLWSLWELG